MTYFNPSVVDTDFTIDGDTLLNMNVDCYNIREVLSEIAMQLEQFQRDIDELCQHRELLPLGDRLTRLEDAFQDLPPTTGHRIHSSQNDFDSQDVLDLRESLPSRFSSLKNEILTEANRRLRLALDSLEFPTPPPPPVLDFPSTATFARLVQRVEELEQSKTSPPPRRHGVTFSKTTSELAPVKSEDFARVLNSITGLRQRLSELEEAKEVQNRQLSELGTSRADHGLQLSRCAQMLRFLTQQMDQMQEEFEGRLRELENRKAPSPMQSIPTEQPQATAPVTDSVVPSTKPMQSIPIPAEQPQAIAPVTDSAVKMAPSTKPLQSIPIPAEQPQAIASVTDSTVKVAPSTKPMQSIPAEQPQAIASVTDSAVKVAPSTKPMQNFGFSHFVAPPIVVQAVARPEPAPVQVVHQVVNAPLDVGDVRDRVARQILEELSPKLERMNNDRNQLRRIVMEQQQMIDLLSKKEKKDDERPRDRVSLESVAISEADDQQGTKPEVGIRELSPIRETIPKLEVSLAKTVDVHEALEEVEKAVRMEPETETIRLDRNKILELTERAGQTDQRITKLESKFLAIDGKITGLMDSVDELGAICQHHSKVPHREVDLITDQILPTPEEDAPLSQSFELPQPTSETIQLETDSVPPVDELTHLTKAPEKPAKGSGKPAKGRVQRLKGPSRNTKGVLRIHDPLQPTNEPVHAIEEAVRPIEEALQPTEERIEQVVEATEPSVEPIRLTEEPKATERQRIAITDHLINRETFDDPPAKPPRDPRTDLALETIARLVNDVADLHLKFDAVDGTTSALRFALSDLQDRSSLPSSIVSSASLDANTANPLPSVRHSSIGLQTIQDIGLQVNVPVDVAVSPRSTVSSSSTRSSPFSPISLQPFAELQDPAVPYVGNTPLQLPAPTQSAPRSPFAPAPGNAPTHAKAKTPAAEARIAAHQQLIDALQSALRDTRDRFLNLHDEVHGLTRRCDSLERKRPPAPAEPQAMPSEDDVRDAVMLEVAQLRLELNQRLLGLTPQQKAEIGEWAPLPVVKQIALNFQTAIDGLDVEIAAIKDFLKNLVSRNDLEAMIEVLQPPAGKSVGETAVGRIRCLLCGKPAAAVKGMITESEVAKMLGTPPQCGVVRGSLGNDYALAYGKDILRTKKKPEKKMVVPVLNHRVNLEALG